MRILIIILLKKKSKKIIFFNKKKEQISGYALGIVIIFPPFIIQCPQ